MHLLWLCLFKALSTFSTHSLSVTHAHAHFYCLHVYSVRTAATPWHSQTWLLEILTQSSAESMCWKLFIYLFYAFCLHTGWSIWNSSSLSLLPWKTSPYGRPVKHFSDSGNFSSRKALLAMFHWLLWQLMWYSDTYRTFFSCFTPCMFNTKYFWSELDSAFLSWVHSSTSFDILDVRVTREPLSHIFLPCPTLSLWPDPLLWCCFNRLHLPFRFHACCLLYRPIDQTKQKFDTASLPSDYYIAGCFILHKSLNKSLNSFVCFFSWDHWGHCLVSFMSSVFISWVLLAIGWVAVGGGDLIPLLCCLVATVQTMAPNDKSAEQSGWSWIWVHFCTLWRSGDPLSIFICQ